MYEINKETLENNLKNIIPLDLCNSSKWDKLNDLELKEYNTIPSLIIKTTPNVNCLTSLG